MVVALILWVSVGLFYLIGDSINNYTDSTRITFLIGWWLAYIIIHIIFWR